MSVPTPDGAQWKRLEELYFRISTLPEEGRTSAIEAACGDDEGLRKQLEALLGKDDVPDEFLVQPALGFSIAEAAVTGEMVEPDLAGQMLGRYRIERLIAHGGMGEVYAAMRADGEIQYRVAVKVVKRGLDTRDVLRRFRTERQTLANLNHPNIARFLDAGATPDGRPYLVLEYVEGERIDEYCRRNGLNTTERLQLFMDVCSAVSSAHQNLVVHRDIKPGNIMVTREGMVKLLDFGIARLLEAQGSAAIENTIPEDRRLTPEYASPEQIDGRLVTTATDIYSLGVVLFELLTGTGPYELSTRTTDELRRAVCHQTPLPPSLAVAHAARAARKDRGAAEATRRLRHTLKRDLDNIVLMALRKEPERRYATVEQFARDIERFLRGLPVIARKDTFAYRVNKFVRRNALLTSGAAAAIIALASLSALAQWKATEAARQRDAAFLARDQAEEITEFLRTVLASADPAQGGPQVTVADALATATRRLESDLADRPLVQAAVRSAIGAAFVGLGQFDEARTHLERAYQDRLELLGDGHHDVAESRFEIAVLEYHIGRYQEAEELLRTALASFIRLRGEDNPDVARMLSSLGAVLRASGKLDEAADVHRRALAMRIRFDGEEHLSVAETLNNLAGVQREQGDVADAIESMQRSLAIRRKALGNEHSLVGQSVGNLAVMLHHQGDLESAAPLYAESLEVLNQTLPAGHPARGTLLTNYSVLMRTQGDLEGEVPLLREALEIRVATLPAGDRRTVITASRLGESLIELRRFEEAEGILLEIAGVVPTGHPDRESVQSLLERLYAAWGRPEDPESPALPEGNSTPDGDGG